jgi:hypothetical protein
MKTVKIKTQKSAFLTKWLNYLNNPDDFWKETLKFDQLI